MKTIFAVTIILAVLLPFLFSFEATSMWNPPVHQKALAALEARRTRTSLDNMFTIMRRKKLVGCVELIVCRVVCDPEGMGEQGKAAFQLIQKFNTTETSEFSGANKETVDSLKAAGMEGLKHAENKDDCSKCDSDFVDCKTPINEMLRMVTMLQRLMVRDVWEQVKREN